MAKYGKRASKKVERAMRKRKHGTLRSGRSGKKVTSRKQAIAIGLSEAREEGDKVPSRGNGRKKRGRKKGGRKTGGRKKSSSRRSSSSRGGKKSGRKKSGRRKKRSSSR